ncbi:unnamed protein product, partial [Amoebophrya sp. A25]|eukprot:GSA25T00017238001.1
MASSSASVAQALRSGVETREVGKPQSQSLNRDEPLQEQAPSSPTSSPRKAFYLVLSLGLHLAFGFFQVIGRYLQTVAGIPAFYLLGGIHAVACIFNFIAHPLLSQCILRSSKGHTSLAGSKNSSEGSSNARSKNQGGTKKFL